MLEELRFLWNATRGFRLRPWKSPYLRWRLETFSGLPADQLTKSSMVQVLWREKLQFLHFLRWTREMKQYGARVASRNR